LVRIDQSLVSQLAGRKETSFFGQTRSHCPLSSLGEKTIYLLPTRNMVVLSRPQTLSTASWRNIIAQWLNEWDAPALRERGRTGLGTP
jgi:hypothetical protein